MKKFSKVLFFNGLLFGVIYGLIAFLPLEVKADLIGMLPEDMDLDALLILGQIGVWAFPLFLLNVQIFFVGLFGLMAKYGLLD